MKKLVVAALLSLGLFSFSPVSEQGFPSPPKSFYDLKINALEGEKTIHFADYKGKKLLLVNTASRCGYTPQYAGLESLYEKYKDRLVVIAFPCNQFGGQEPDSALKIGEFCKRRYGVTFPISEKVDVKGDNQHTVYQWLTQKKYNGREDVNIRWNFGKFLIDEKGKFVQYFPSQVTPGDSSLIAKIEETSK